MNTNEKENWYMGGFFGALFATVAMSGVTSTVGIFLILLAIFFFWGIAHYPR